MSDLEDWQIARLAAGEFDINTNDIVDAAWDSVYANGRPDYDGGAPYLELRTKPAVESLAHEVQHLRQLVERATEGQVMLRGLLRDAYPLLPTSPQRDAIHDLLALAEELPPPAS